MKDRSTGVKTKEIVITALMIALVFIAGSVIRIPTIGGFIHLGDCMVFLSAIVLGKRRGTIASAVGMALVDIISGYFMWAPFTFLIKGGMAYIAGAILEKIGGSEKRALLKKEDLIAFVASGIFMVVGYFIAGVILAGFLTDDLGLIGGLAIAVKDIFTNVIQVVAGIVIAIPLSTILITAKNRVFN